MPRPFEAGLANSRLTPLAAESVQLAVSPQ